EGSQIPTPTSTVTPTPPPGATSTPTPAPSGTNTATPTTVPTGTQTRTPLPTGTPPTQTRTPTPNTPVPLLINEVYDTLNPRSEYVELVNTSTITNPILIDLYAYTLYNKDGIQPLSNLTTTLRFIGPGQHFAIGAAQLGTPTLVGNGLDGSGDYLGL